MKAKSFLLVMIFALTPLMWAQSAPDQGPASGPGRGQLRAEHRQDMMEMHREETEAMKADVEKMKVFPCADEGQPSHDQRAERN